MWNSIVPRINIEFFPQVIDLETSAASLSLDEKKHLRAQTRNSSGVSQSTKLKTASKYHEGSGRHIAYANSELIFELFIG